MGSYFELMELPDVQGRRLQRGHYAPSEASIALPVQSTQVTLKASKLLIVRSSQTTTDGDCRYVNF